MEVVAGQGEVDSMAFVDNGSDSAPDVCKCLDSNNCQLRSVANSFEFPAPALKKRVRFSSKVQYTHFLRFLQMVFAKKSVAQSIE